MTKKSFKALDRESTNIRGKVEVPAVVAEQAPVQVHVKQREKKEEAPKLPEEVATKNETLGVYVVQKDPMTYLGQQVDKSTWLWRATTNPQRLFTKLEEVTTAHAADDPLRKKKIAEVYKSFTHPVAKAGFTVKMDKAFPKPAPNAE